MGSRHFCGETAERDEDWLLELETDHLNQAPESISIDGGDVCLYGVLASNENSHNRRIGGPAVLDFVDHVTCLHR